MAHTKRFIERSITDYRNCFDSSR